jgi:hypothetical protein
MVEERRYPQLSTSHTSRRSNDVPIPNKQSNHVYQTATKTYNKRARLKPSATNHESWQLRPSMRSACLMLHAEVPPEGSFSALAIPDRATHVDCVLEKQAKRYARISRFSSRKLRNNCRNLGVSMASCFLLGEGGPSLVGFVMLVKGMSDCWPLNITLERFYSS